MKESLFTLLTYSAYWASQVVKNLLASAGDIRDAGCSRSLETCIFSYVKQLASPGSMHETGCSGLVHWDDPAGWGGEGGGRGVQDVRPRLIHVNVRQKPLQYCKVISLQLK